MIDLELIILICFGAFFVFNIVVSIFEYVKKELCHDEFRQRQRIITKQDRLQDVLVVMGLRETMEFQRASFKYSEVYSLGDGRRR